MVGERLLHFFPENPLIQSCHVVPIDAGHVIFPSHVVLFNKHPQVGRRQLMFDPTVPVAAPVLRG